MEMKFNTSIHKGLIYNLMTLQICEGCNNDMRHDHKFLATISIDLKVINNKNNIYVVFIIYILKYLQT